MPKSELFDVSCVIVAETDSAIRINDGSKRPWLPRSQIEIFEQKDGRTVIVTMPLWLAEEKELV